MFAEFFVIIFIFVLTMIGVIAYFTYYNMKQKQFKDAANKIGIGMSKNEVFDILGEPEGDQINQEGYRCVYVWKKVERKNIRYGGSFTRKITIIFENEKVVNIKREEIPNIF